MARVLRVEIGRRACLSRLEHNLATRKRGRIQIVPEIEAHWSNRCPVAHSYSNGVRNVVVITLVCCGCLQTQVLRLLIPLQQIVEHVVSAGKDITSVMEDSEADIVLKKR